MAYLCGTLDVLCMPSDERWLVRVGHDVYVWMCRSGGEVVRDIIRGRRGETGGRCRPVKCISSRDVRIAMWSTCICMCTQHPIYMYGMSMKKNDFRKVVIRGYLKELRSYHQSSTTSTPSKITKPPDGHCLPSGASSQSSGSSQSRSQLEDQ